MEIPVHRIVENLVSQLNESMQEEFEERAGIIEVSMKIDRGHAECLALLQLFTSYPVVLITRKSSTDIPSKTGKK